MRIEENLQLDNRGILHGVLRMLFDFTVHTWGTQIFPELLKKIYLKYLYKFETLVPFEVLPLRLDAAIPAPFPMLETLSKSFNGNAVKGRQRFREFLGPPMYICEGGRKVSVPDIW